MRTTETTVDPNGREHLRTYEDGRQIAVEIKHHADAKCPMDIESLLPKTQRTYWNQATESYVSYQRARQLGINTDIEPEIHI